MKLYNPINGKPWLNVTTGAKALANAPDIIRTIGSNRAVFEYNTLDRQHLLRAYNSVPEFKAIVDYKAKVSTTGKFRLFQIKDGKEEEIFSHKVLDLLSNPNPLQDQDEFMEYAHAMLSVFGDLYIYGGTPAGFKVNWETIETLWTLPSLYMQIIPGKYLFSAETKREVIKEYVLNYNGKTIPFNPDNIYQQNDINLNFSNDYNTECLRTPRRHEYLYGRSRAVNLSKPLSNIEISYEAENVLIAKHGAIGILSDDTKDTIRNIPLDDPEIQRLQEEYQNYGLTNDQWQIIISKHPLKWQQIAMPKKDLMLNDTINNSVIAICNSYAFPILLMNYLKGSTFSNLNESKKKLYEDSTIPDWEKMERGLNNFLKLPEYNLKLKIDYSHIPVLQEDLKEKATKNKIIGGSVLAIQKQVAEGNTVYSAAVEMLQTIHGFSEEKAVALLGSEEDVKKMIALINRVMTPGNGEQISQPVIN